MHPSLRHRVPFGLTLFGILACAGRPGSGSQSPWTDPCRNLTHAAEDTATFGGQVRLSTALQSACPARAADAVAAALHRTRHDADSTHYVAWRNAASALVDAAVYDSALAVIADSTAQLGARLSAYVLLTRMDALEKDPRNWFALPIAEDSLRACRPFAPHDVHVMSTTHTLGIRVRPLSAAHQTRGRAVLHRVGSAPTTPRPLRLRLGYCPAAG